MPKQNESDFDRVARVIQRPSGQWEVRVAYRRADEKISRWQHKRMFRTEQEAEAYARTLLPYCDTAWDSIMDPSTGPPGDVAFVRPIDRGRKPRHQPDY